MPRYAGHSSHKTKETWQISCNAVNAADIAADGKAPMSPIALAIWAAGMAAGDTFFDLLPVPPLPGSGAYFHTEMSVSDDPQFRSISITVTYRRP